MNASMSQSIHNEFELNEDSNYDFVKAILEDSNINYYFVKQEIEYIQYLFYTLNQNYKYYQFPGFD